MSATASGIWTPSAPETAQRSAETPRDGLATASLVLGVAGFLPVPGLAASVMAIVLGTLSGRRDADGRRRRNGAAVTGIVLGCVSIGLFLLLDVVYFGVLGHPLPQIHRYQPPVPSHCSCQPFVGVPLRH